MLSIALSISSWRRCGSGNEARDGAPVAGDTDALAPPPRRGSAPDEVWRRTPGRKRRARSGAHRQGSSLPPPLGWAALGVRTVAAVSVRGKIKGRDVSRPAARAASFASGVMEAILIERTASVCPIPRSFAALLMTRSFRCSRPSGRLLSITASCGDCSFSAGSRTHSAMSQRRSVSDRSARRRFSAISQMRTQASVRYKPISRRRRQQAIL
jgi:hypothetical protein